MRCRASFIALYYCKRLVAKRAMTSYSSRLRRIVNPHRTIVVVRVRIAVGVLHSYSKADPDYYNIGTWVKVASFAPTISFSTEKITWNDAACPEY